MADDKVLTLRGKIIDPFKGAFEGCVTFQGGSIIAVGRDDSGTQTAYDQSIAARGAEVEDFSGCYISPGFIDLHVHGGRGADFIEATLDSVEKITGFHAAGGTTGMLATVLPLPRRELLRCLKRLIEIISTENHLMVKLLGLHLEGPFINKARKGALVERYLSMPDLDYFAEICEAAGGLLRMITIAPELRGAEALTIDAVRRGVLVSAGHTESSAMELGRFHKIGLRNVTHFYNVMAGFFHRSPGTVGGALVVDGLMVDLIPEENHVHPDAFRLAWKIKGPDKISIISDCTSPGGMPDGEYSLGGNQVFLEQGIARLRDGTLAGSTITMINGIKYLVKQVGIRVEDAVGLASTNPARLMGMENKKGWLQQGFDADITVFDENFEVIKTIVGGKVGFSKQ